MSVEWITIGTAGVVTAKPVDGKFTAYRTLPVCPKLNWTGTYPDTSCAKFEYLDQAITWVEANPAIISPRSS